MNLHNQGETNCISAANWHCQIFCLCLLPPCNGSPEQYHCVELTLLSLNFRRTWLWRAPIVVAVVLMYWCWWYLMILIRIRCRWYLMITVRSWWYWILFQLLCQLLCLPFPKSNMILLVLLGKLLIIDIYLQIWYYLVLKTLSIGSRAPFKVNNRSCDCKSDMVRNKCKWYRPN